MSLNSFDLPLLRSFKNIVLIEDRPTTRQIIINAICMAFPNTKLYAPSDWSELIECLPKKNDKPIALRKTLFLTDHSLDQNGFKSEKLPHELEQEKLTNGFSLAKYLINKKRLHSIVYSVDLEQIIDFERETNPKVKCFDKQELLDYFKGYENKFVIETDEKFDISWLAKTPRLFAQLLARPNEYKLSSFHLGKGRLESRFFEDRINRRISFVSRVKPNGFLSSLEFYIGDQVLRLNNNNSIAVNLKKISNYSLEEWGGIANTYLFTTVISKAIDLSRSKSMEDILKRSEHLFNSLRELCSESIIDSLALEFVVTLNETIRKLGDTPIELMDLNDKLYEVGLPIINKVRYGKVEKELERNKRVRIISKLSAVQHKTFTNIEVYSYFRNKMIFEGSTFREVYYLDKNEKKAQVDRYELSIDEQF